MAAGTSLVLSFATASGSTTHTWKYAKANATKANVQALITATITNGELFSAVPTAIKSAKIVTTTEQAYDLDEVMTSNGRDLRHMISYEPEEGEPEGEATSVDIPVETKAEKRARLERELAEL